MPTIHKKNLLYILACASHHIQIKQDMLVYQLVEKKNDYWLYMKVSLAVQKDNIWNLSQTYTLVKSVCLHDSAWTRSFCKKDITNKTKTIRKIKPKKDIQIYFCNSIHAGSQSTTELRDCTIKHQDVPSY